MASDTDTKKTQTDTTQTDTDSGPTASTGKDPEVPVSG